MRGRIHRWAVVLAAVPSLVSCASPPPPPPPAERPLYVNGVRQEPLVAEEVGREVGSRAEEFSKCYARERLNLDGGALSDYVFRVRVPNDGTKPEVALESATSPTQKMLESCIQTTLGAMRFPAHVGQPLTIKVPIRAPR